MEQSTPENYDDNAGAPEVLRCKRSDGKQWRCNAPCMPDKTVCEKHYYQAKKRAANSAMRASMKRSKRKLSGEDDIYLESKSDDFDIPLTEMEGSDYSRPVSGKKYKGSKYVEYSPEATPVRSSLLSNSHRHVDDVEEPEEDWGSSVLAARNSSGNRSHHGFETNAAMGYSDGSIDSSEDEGGETCHQCQQSVTDGVIWCSKCDRRGYCRSCISEWYPGDSLEDLREACPACRGSCVCKTCLRADNKTKTRIRDIPVLDRLRYLSYLLSSLLPVVQQIYHEQCFEVELEKELHGPEINLPRVKLAADEQMCCNICRIPIVDYHRHCPNCMHDLCLHCCRDLRVASRESTGETENGRDSIDPTNAAELRLNLRGNYPDWRAGSDGRIPCPPKKYGGCGHPSLKLNRIFKMNWVAKLAKNVDEMVSGCRLDTSNCRKDAGSNASVLATRSISEGGDTGGLYDPIAGNIRVRDISEFLMHFRMGEPVIVREVWDKSLSSGWDPIVIWRGILETDDEKMKAENRKVKVTDYLNKSEADIELDQFMKGYFGGLRQNGSPHLLKLKDWPSASASEEFLLYHKVEFIKKMPLMEYIHPRLGILNVTAKLPHYSLQSDVGPKISISYGAKEDLGDANSVSKLHLKMRDMVYLLVHACEVKYKSQHLSSQESTPQIKAATFSREPFMNGGKLDGVYEVEADLHEKKDSHLSPDSETRRFEDQESGLISSSLEETRNGSGECQSCGAIWDIFRRQDVPKLIQYLQNHRNDFGKPDAFDEMAANPLFEEAIYLDEQHKRKLKEEFGVVPWSVQQGVGDAVFIPAGCPFQLRNLQSNVQLGLDFLSPDSLGEAIKLGEEIRCLQNGHEAKLQILEVVKMSLYVASSAIKEVQKLVLDPKFSSEVSFEDCNLTVMVSDNLEKITKQKQVKCA
ncbi:hypothetical protein MLD38_017839 [Melastoma candidum]|uniref:Uncharacterized protein n=1 Tax=Melastoma candidum TaxID=119954 RepID=A0ACB9R070_9MYRT|nr:hypothetical protein MLD38_017839 [Melastoma candidum]